MQTIANLITNNALTAKEIAEKTGRSEARVRELLKGIEGLKCHEGKPAKFELVVEVTTTTDKPKRVLLNPQPKIRAFQEELAQVGGSLVFESRQWIATVDS